MTDVAAPTSEAPPASPEFGTALRFWLKLGFISFGGPSGQIAIMHTELVERRRWVDERSFLHALNYCMLLPGPEAQQLATYLGWRMHGVRGGIVAGALFVLPAAVLLWLLSLAYVTWGNLPWLAAVFDGLKPAVLAIVLAALWRIGRRALKAPADWGLAALAFAALFFGGAPFPAVVAGAAVIGFAGQRWAPRLFGAEPKSSAGTDGAPAKHATPAPTLGRALRVIGVCGALWWTPVLACALIFGGDHAFVALGLFFSKAAMVTFGGAYAVLPYVSQQAVEHFHWLAPGQMIDGLALAETTPGPLIMVLQFVGFLGGGKFAAPLSPLAGATLGAALTTWVTFVPSFLWIFLGAPYVERLRGIAWLDAALGAVTAAVVGVILNLALWFGLHALLPAGQPVNWFGVAVAAVAFLGLQRWKWDLLLVVGGAALLGLARWAAGF